MDEKPITDLIQEQGIELAIPDDTDIPQIQAMVAKAKTMSAASVVQDLDQTFMQAYGGHIPDENKQNVLYWLERVNKWAKFIDQNPTRQTNIAQFNAAVQDLENALENAKTGAREHIQRERSLSRHSMAGIQNPERILNSISGANRKQFAEFYTKHRTQNRGPASLAQMLKSYAKDRGMSAAAQRRTFTYPVLDKIVAIHGSAFGMTNKLSNLLSTRQLLTGFERQNVEDFENYSKHTISRPVYGQPMETTQRPTSFGAGGQHGRRKTVRTQFAPVVRKKPEHIESQSMTNIFSDPLTTFGYDLQPPPNVRSFRDMTPPMTQRQRTPSEEGKQEDDQKDEPAPLPHGFVRAQPRPGLSRGSPQQEPPQSADAVAFRDWFSKASKRMIGKSMKTEVVAKRFAQVLNSKRRVYRGQIPLRDFVRNEIRAMNMPHVQRSGGTWKFVKHVPPPTPAAVRDERKRQERIKSREKELARRSGYAKDIKDSNALLKEARRLRTDATNKERENLAERKRIDEKARRERSTSRMSEDIPEEAGAPLEEVEEKAAEPSEGSVKSEYVESNRLRAQLSNLGNEIIRLRNRFEIGERPQGVLLRIREKNEERKKLNQALIKEVDKHLKTTKDSNPHNQNREWAVGNRADFEQVDDFLQESKEVKPEEVSRAVADVVDRPGHALTGVVTEANVVQWATETQMRDLSAGVGSMSLGPQIGPQRDEFDQQEHNRFNRRDVERARQLAQDSLGAPTTPLPRERDGFFSEEDVASSEAPPLTGVRRMFSEVEETPGRFKPTDSQERNRIRQEQADLLEAAAAQRRGLVVHDTPAVPPIPAGTIHSAISPPGDEGSIVMIRGTPVRVPRTVRMDRTGHPIAFISPDGTELSVPQNPEELDEMLENGQILRDTPEFKLFRDILRNRRDVDGRPFAPPDTALAEGLGQGRRRRQRAHSVGYEGQDLTDAISSEFAGDLTDYETDSDPGSPIRPYRPNAPAAPPLGVAAGMRRLAGAGGGAGYAAGLARVRAGAANPAARAVVNFPLGRGRVRNIQLRDARFRPQHFDPDVHRHVVYTNPKDRNLGREFRAFRRQNAELDPMTTLTCSQYAQSREIGEHIQMCIEPNSIKIVVYTRAPLKALEVLVKKLKYHTKKMTNASLSEHGAGVLYDYNQLQKLKVRNIAETLLQLLRKRRSMLRLILNGSTAGGPLSKDWMHTASAMRVI